MVYPAISVVIPLYNAEKYIGECLDSLIAQTFQNFEVIVVDDCSTDNSAAVVESYRDKFDGRLVLARTKKNSGNPSFPCNKGLSLSRGEYISFLDDDDTIIPTAFEELYPIAKEFDADVIACEKYFSIPEKFWNDAEFRKQLKPYSYQKGDFVSEPTLITDNLAERLQRYVRGGFLANLWSKLIRHDLILHNEISFADTIIADMIFTSCLVLSAKRYVHVPNVINCYRVIEGSVSHTTKRDTAYFVKYLRALTAAFRYFDEFLSGREFFQQRPDIKYLALENVWNLGMYYLRGVMYTQIPAHQFYAILREEFLRGDNTALSTFAFNVANIRHLQLLQANQRIAELENEINRLKLRSDLQSSDT